MNSGTDRQSHNHTERAHAGAPAHNARLRISTDDGSGTIAIAADDRIDRSYADSCVCMCEHAGGEVQMADSGTECAISKLSRLFEGRAPKTQTSAERHFRC